MKINALKFLSFDGLSRVGEFFQKNMLSSRNQKVAAVAFAAVAAIAIGVAVKRYFFKVSKAPKRSIVSISSSFGEGRRSVEKMVQGQEQEMKTFEARFVSPIEDDEATIVNHSDSTTSDLQDEEESVHGEGTKELVVSAPIAKLSPFAEMKASVEKVKKEHQEEVATFKKE